MRARLGQKGWSVWVGLSVAALAECRSQIIEGQEPILVPVGAVWAYHVNRLDGGGPPSGWWLPEFDDTSWPRGRSGFGSGLGDETTVVDRTNVVSACFRTTFHVDQPDSIRWLTLRAGFQSGLAVWLNGQEVRRTGLPEPPSVWNQVVTFSWRFYTREFDLTAFRHLLRPGRNVLAVQVHSHTTNPASLFWSGELWANLTRGPFLQQMQPRSVRILWRTPVPVTARLRYGMNTGLDRELVWSEPRTSHVAILTNLEPATEWFYRIELAGSNSAAVTPIWSFRTPPERGSLRFVVVGDTGSGTLPMLQVASCLSTAAMDLILHTGDLVYPELTRELVDLRCLSVYAPLLRRVPLYPTVGNHELYNTLYRDPPGTPYFESFDPPTNQVTGTGHFYSFDMGEAHFVSLFVPTLLPFPGTEPYQLGPGSAQLRWLQQDLASTDRPWRIVFMHSPMFSSGGRRFDDLNTNGVADRLELQTWLLPIFRRYGVQVAFFGHDHVYERFRAWGPLHAWTTGGGGYTLYGFTERDALSERFAVIFHHLECELTRDELRVVARDRFGQVFDTAVVPRVVRPGLEAMVRTNHGSARLELELKWNSAPGERYTVESSRSAEAGFEPVAELTADDFLTSWSTSVSQSGEAPESGRAVFYRVKWQR